MIKFKKYNNQYESQVINLLNLCFHNKKITTASFNWKHFNSFFQNKTISMIALNGNTVYSFVCFTPINIKGYDNFYSCAIQVTHPKYRKQGLVSILTQKIEKTLGGNINYIGFSNKDGILIDKNSKKINYKILGQFYTKYILSYPYNTKIKFSEVINIQEIKNNSKYLQIKKNNPYLAWRYTNNPKIKFQYLEITKNKKVIGYTIFTKNKKYLNILDLLLLNNNQENYFSIYKALSNYAFHKKVFFISTSFLKNTFWENNFPKLSFSKKQKIYFTLKSTNNTLLSLNDWLLLGGDIQ